MEQPILIGDTAGLINEVSLVSPFHSQHLTVFFDYAIASDVKYDPYTYQNIKTYHKAELLLRRDFTVQLFNVSMLTLDGQPTRRARVLLRPVEVMQSRFVASKPRFSDNEVRSDIIPYGGIPFSMTSGFGELPEEGIPIHSDIRVQLLLLSYPNCAPEESFILRVCGNG